MTNHAHVSPFYKLQQDARDVLSVAKKSDKELLDSVEAYFPEKIDSIYQMALFEEFMSRCKSKFANNDIASQISKKLFPSETDNSKINHDQTNRVAS